MTKLRWIQAYDDCPVCGSAVMILTAQDQTCPCPGGSGNCADHNGYWWGQEDDEARCFDCGATGFVTIDGDEAHVSIDEESDYNVACADLYATHKTSVTREPKKGD